MATPCTGRSAETDASTWILEDLSVWRRLQCDVELLRNWVTSGGGMEVGERHYNSDPLYYSSRINTTADQVKEEKEYQNA